MENKKLEKQAIKLTGKKEKDSKQSVLEETEAIKKWWGGSGGSI